VRSSDVLVEAGRLAAAGEPFALATVVSVVRPASAKRGDRALVTADGELRGWIGGACSEPTVVREALRALGDGEPRVVRIEGGCASEGVVDVLVEPQLAQPLLAVLGESPAARTLADLARTIGWRVTADLQEADAVVVATMGHADEEGVAAALKAGADYVGLVASAQRGAAVREALRERGFDDEALARVRSPAGIDLGPSRQEEIAVAVLAELVTWKHNRAGTPTAWAEAVDPVCGMTVAVQGARELAVHEDVTYHFCGPGCRARFEEEPARYLGVEAP
jgi:xanthine dehydrogenase accessory factor